MDGLRRLGQWRLGALELPEDRGLAGKLAGLLYLAGALAAAVMLMLPDLPRHDPGIVVALSALGAAWGIACLTVVRWERAPRVVSHLSSSAGFVITAVLVALMGGPASPARFLLLFIAFYAAYFYPPRTTAVYLAGCCLFYGLPMIYSPTSAFAAELAVMVPTFVLLGGGVAAGKSRLLQLRAQAERATERHRALAAEQAVLRRLATAVAAERGPEEIYRLVSVEAAEMLGADASGVLRFDSPEQTTVLGAYSRSGQRSYPVGQAVPVRPGSDMAQLWHTESPVLIADHVPGSPVDQLGYRCTVVAPVHVGARLWGLVAIAGVEAAQFDEEAVRRLADFAALLATSVQNTEDRRRLREMASTDPLTGLANHRTFHDRLEEEVARARRHGRALALVLLDLDQFKAVNDTAGHGTGDEVLRGISGRLAQGARGEDVLARIGGDEFALLLPETTAMEALSVVERLRADVVAELVQGYRLTLSAGISDLSHATAARELFSFADGALYWAKARGRDCAWVYDPEVVRELSAQERAERLERSQALSALRALARAIDAKDPLTRRHSEGVAALARGLAEQVGWSARRIELLGEAALVHDVGKIGVRDDVLLKNGRLSEVEYEEVKKHALLGAEIAQEVLSDEQVRWIRGHHERPDGAGYPDGLEAGQISDGAALLALADAFDVMTRSRPYSTPKPVPDALEECRRLADRQFSAFAVDALEALAREGRLNEAHELRSLSGSA